MKNEILVIDDNSDIRFLICKILKENDYLVREAANYDQAIFEIKKKIQIHCTLCNFYSTGDHNIISHQTSKTFLSES